MILFVAAGGAVGLAASLAYQAFGST